MPEHASRAFIELDGTICSGRMLHLLPALPSNEKNDDEIPGTIYSKIIHIFCFFFF